MSHCEALLDLLAPGRWLSTYDILRVEPMMVHSRVAELRARGYEIEHKRVGVGSKGSLYRLVGALEREAGSRGEPSPASPSNALTEGARAGGDGGRRATNSVAQAGTKRTTDARSVREAEGESTSAAENGKTGQEVGLTARASFVSASAGRESSRAGAGETHAHPPAIPAGVSAREHEGKQTASQTADALTQLVLTGDGFRRGET